MIEKLWDEFIAEVSKDSGISESKNLLGSIGWHKKRFMSAAAALNMVEAFEQIEAYQESCARRTRLEQIVAFLFPRRKDTKTLIHPDKSWWWNGAVIDENDVDIGCAGSGASCTVRSYVGSGETDTFALYVPGEWMSAEDFKSLIIAWVNAENERRMQALLETCEEKAKRDLDDAVKRLAEIQSKKGEPK